MQLPVPWAGSAWCIPQRNVATAQMLPEPELSDFRAAPDQPLQPPRALQGPRVQRFARCVCVVLNSSPPLCHAGLWLTKPLQTKLPGSAVVMQSLRSYFRRMSPLSVLAAAAAAFQEWHSQPALPETQGQPPLACSALFGVSTQLILPWLQKLRTLHLQMFAAECAEHEALCRTRHS